MGPSTWRNKFCLVEAEGSNRNKGLGRNLKFMNLNLTYYKNQKKVWHISGWNYNVNFNVEEDAYFTRGMNCWGWGTWRDRWKYFEKKPNVIIKSWTRNKIFRFNNIYCII